MSPQERSPRWWYARFAGLLTLAALLAPDAALALHRESPPVAQITNADTHQHPVGRSWGNWFAFSSTQDLANLGAQRHAGRQIFIWNQAYFDCAHDTTGVFATGFCPPAGTPWLFQITNGPGNPDNPTAGVPAINQPQDDIWISFDADGTYNCGTNATCLASGQAGHRQIFLQNFRSHELKQVTASAAGDSTHPSGNAQLGVVAFESTAPLGGFPNPAGVPQLFVYERLCQNAGTGNCGVSTPIQISVGPGPTNVVGRGPSIHGSVNQTGTAIAFQSSADLLGTGADTGINQIFVANFDKQNRRVTALRQVTHGNGSSINPMLGDKKDAVGPAKNFLFFESLATDIPGTLGLSGSQIYEVSMADANVPSSIIQQVTSSGLFGDCHFPTSDPSGNRLGFVCTGDPLQNLTTGNRAFVLDRSSQTLYQITGAGEVQGPIGLSIGQWFMTLATSSDLTGNGICGFQLFVVDYFLGKWGAATALHQLPQDAIGGVGSTKIGFRNFELQTGTATGGSQLVLATATGTVTTPITAPGRIGLTIGAPDPILQETTVDAVLNRIKMPAVPVPGYGAFCIDATDGGSGFLDCDGGRLDGSIATSRDHVTDDADFSCRLGCRDNDPTCTDGQTASHLFACPTCQGNLCVGGPNNGLACAGDKNCQTGMACSQCPFCDPTVQRCAGGPFDGTPCSLDSTCQFNVQCNVEPVCQGPEAVVLSGTYSAGGLRIGFPIKVSMSTSPGPDGAWCTDDDLWTTVRDVPVNLRLTTETVTGTVTDADPAPGVLGTTVTDTQTGAPFLCDRLKAGDLAGSRLVASFPLLNLETIAGLHDAVLSFVFEPKPDAASSCQAFCTTAADCNDGDVCNGTETCVANRCQPGTPLVCNDNDACNGVETCNSTSGCQPGTPPNCNDNNLCTTDTCDATLGCQNTVTVVCGDGLVCNGTETCNPTTGTCQAGTPLNCDDGNSCTTDTCAEPNGCQHSTLADGVTCNDGNLCTTGDTCTGGACVGTPVTCVDPNNNVCDGVPFCDRTSGLCVPGQAPTVDDGNPCTTDSCDPIQGVQHVPLTGTPCSDNNACTTGDVCNAGQCQGTATLACTDGNACNGIETCEPSIGCVPGTPVTCDDANTCTTDTCNPVDGSCTHVPLTGPTCDDGSACTINDSCQAGICTGAPLPCDDHNACNGVESCDPVEGCQPGTPLQCNDNNDCTTDTCDAATGCVNAPVPNGTACNDGDLCTVNDACQVGHCQGAPACDDGNACNGVEACNPLNGTCTPATAPNCDDGNPCTDDSCDTTTGCVHTPNTNPCNDGNACTVGDVCTNGSCVGSPLTCSDNNACNGVETCNPLTGCVPGAVPNCDDGDSCTTDTCDPVQSCQNTPVPNYALCRANAFASAILTTPAEDLGGNAKKQKLVRLSSAAVKLLQKASAANPRQRRANLRAATTKLLKAVNLLQRLLTNGSVKATIANPLITLGRSTATAVSALR